MRFLFMPLPGVGHSYPMVPLAWALRCGGHDVLVAVVEDSLALRNAGLTVADAMPGVTMRHLLRRLAEEQPDVTPRSSSGTHELRSVSRWLTHASAYLTDALVTIAEWFRPDVVIYSPLNGAALVAAERSNAVAVELRYSCADENGLLDLQHQELLSLFNRFGVSDRPRPVLTIDVVPRSVRTTPTDSVLLRPVVYNGGMFVPEWLRTEQDRPRVLVTTGTVRLNGLTTSRRVAEIAGDVTVEFLLTVDEAESRELGPLPPNVRAVGWVPLGMILNTCSAVIHHGGSGTALNALIAGIPQLIVPEGADQHANGEALSQRGVGVITTHEMISVATITHLMTTRKFTSAATQVAAEISRMPSLCEVVAILEHAGE